MTVVLTFSELAKEIYSIVTSPENPINPNGEKILIEDYKGRRINDGLVVEFTTKDSANKPRVILEAFLTGQTGCKNKLKTLEFSCLPNPYLLELARKKRIPEFKNVFAGFPANNSKLPPYEYEYGSETRGIKGLPVTYCLSVR